jgi:hypothetical protein
MGYWYGPFRSWDREGLTPCGDGRFDTVPTPRMPPPCAVAPGRGGHRGYGIRDSNRAI